MLRPHVLAAAAFALGVFASAVAQAAPDLKETPFLTELVEQGKLPAVAERLPQAPLVSDLDARGRTIGKPGGTLVTLAARARDIRFWSAYGYARLVGYDLSLNSVPDIVERVDVENDRVFTFHLRPGHRWSDGQPFTAEDFRYWWQDVANEPALSPAGPPEFMLVDGKAPTFEVLSPSAVRYTFTGANPRFLPALAQPRDPFIYRPAHYLKPFHAKYSDKTALEKLAKEKKLKSWAALHNRLDDMYDFANPSIPTLQPWRITNAAPAQRFIFERNPYFHRVDSAGQQLPYIDRIVVDIVSPGLMAAKANAGEVDFLARGLSPSDVPILKEGEARGRYRTLLWPVARGSAFALYPNLTTNDPLWRALLRDRRFRQALSLGIDRRTLNNALLFGLGQEGNNTVIEASPLYRPAFRTLHAQNDTDMANRLLDQLGLTGRDPNGFRLLPDGRPLEIVVEVEGDAGSIIDSLELIAEFWREIGVKLFVKPQDRTVLRNRSYAGQTVMVAEQGLDNAMPTADMVPNELAPVRQDHYAWPKWGQYVETSGKNGEAVDMEAARRLMTLFRDWSRSQTKAERETIWLEMLATHAEEQFVIGTVSGALHPIVVRNSLRNVPERAYYSWEPTSLLGIYRMDEFYFDRPQGVAQR